MAAMLLETFSVGMVLPLISIFTGQAANSRFQWATNFFGTSSQEILMVYGVVVLFALFLIKNAFAYFNLSFQRAFLNKAESRLSQKAFRTYLLQPYEFHLQHNSATLINNAEIAKTIISGGLEPFLTLLTDGLVAAGLFVLLIAIEPVGSLITLAVFGGASFAFQRITRDRINEWGRLRKQSLALVLKHLQQGLGGAKEIKLLGREKLFLRDHENHLEQAMEATRKFKMLQLLPRFWLEVMGVGCLAVLVVTMRLTDKTVDQILPVLGLFAATAFRIIPSVARMLVSAQGVAFSAPQIRAVYDDFLLEPDVIEGSGEEVVFANELKFENVTFKYASSHSPSLSKATFSVFRGDSVGIIGPSGSGKSTLIDLLLGLLTPSEGTVLVDGIPIRSNLRSWQSIVGYVPQSIYLLDETILKNVAFGIDDSEVDERRVREVIEIARLTDFIQSLPNGLKTVVGERGVRLSGGQRQRIGIARALYNNPALLVLDEATSSLDDVTESELVEAVNILQATRTVVIVAHRLSTVANCNRIFRVDESEIQEVSKSQIFPHS